MYRSIIVGIDGREGGLDALALGRALAATEGARVTLACAYLNDPIVARLVPGDVEPLHATAVAHLEAAHHSLGDMPADVRALATSSPARGLHGLAAEIGADLIVVGSSHRGALGRVFLGSVAQQVLHGSPCAVAVAPAGLRSGEPTVLRRIGCAYDGGAESRAALASASAIAEQLGAALEIIDVLAPVPVFPAIAGGYALPEPIEEVEAAVRAELDDAVASVGELPAAGVMPEGDPAEQLTARSQSLDMLVMGSRAYGPVRRVLLGTVAGQVIRDAHCPVLVIPRGSHEDDAAAAAS